MNKTIDLFTSIESSDSHRLSTSELVQPRSMHRRLDNKMHQSLDISAIIKSKMDKFSYRPPNNDYLWKKGPFIKLSKAKISSYLEEHTNSLKHVPCPTKYSKLGVWGQRYSGKFRRATKISMSEIYMKRSKEIPACNQYETLTKPKIKIKGNYKSTLPKYSVIDSLMEVKQALPGPNKYSINLKNVKPRTTVCKFSPIKRERFEKIIKDNLPGPTSYESPN